MKSLYIVRALAIVPIILLWTGIMALVSVFLSLFDRDGSLQHACAQTWARFVLWISDVELHAWGFQSISASQPFIVVSNHQSFFDIFSMLARLPFQFRFFAKDSLFRTPFLGWHLKRAGHLPIDRSNARAAYLSFQRATERIKGGMCVLIFPEGSRSTTGAIGSFKKGSLRLALTSGVPVLPIAIYGSVQVLPKGSFLIFPGRIDMLAGEPVFPTEENLKDKEGFVEIVRARVITQYGILESARRRGVEVINLAANERG
jgi:1-acyl-sn-glycerol-3-phosphate acyltransferase